MIRSAISSSTRCRDELPPGLGGLSLAAVGRSGGGLALGFGLGAGRVGLTALGGHETCFLLQGWCEVVPGLGRRDAAEPRGS